jgi:uncharacterized Ntn-hydrolase superfamily protein
MARKRSSGIPLLILFACLASAAQAAPRWTARGPVATFSIVARDSVTGQMGVAVQSHWFSVGSVVPWAEAGVGAVATQSFVDPRYGPLGLDLMRLGRSAPEALLALVSTDEGEDVRQVAMIDDQGRVAVHTGEHAVADAGDQLGAQFSVQANLMENDEIWPAMAEAYETAKGDLADRMLAALRAGQAAGGDIRGKQSAALLVVTAESTGRPWHDRIFDLRVEDAPDPIAELSRLVQLQRAYLKLNEGDEFFAEGDLEQAIAAYREATSLVPDEATNGEAAFWVGVTLAGAGQVDRALPYLRRAQAQDANWAVLIERLPAAGLLPDDPALIEQLTRAMRQKGD